MINKRPHILLLLVILLGTSITPGLSQPYDPDPVIDAAAEIGTLRSLIVYKDESILLSESFRGGGTAQPYNIKSASKSILSLLTGIALQQGYIDSLQTPVSRWFPDYFKDHPDPVKEQITLEDLLTMRSGLETTSFYNYGRWVVSENWAEFQLDQPLVEDPGGKMVYSTGTTHLISVILTKASGMSTRELAREYLFGPMGIQIGGWDKDPQGYYMGGNNLALSPEALMKIGRMLLNGGIWEGKQIIHPDWLKRSFKTYTRSNFNPYNYGYLWWIIKRKGTPIYFAWGFGGQYLFLLPEYDAAVVITNSLANATQRRSYKEPIFDLLEEQILPFIME